MLKGQRIQVTELEFDNMKHSVGYKPANVHGGIFVMCRNFFSDNNSARSKKEWERLIKYGYAERIVKDTDTHLYYRVTPEGQSFMERMLGIIFKNWGK